MNKKRITGIARLTLTAVVAFLLAGYAQARNHRPSDKVIVVGPADLPELARITGQAMLLHDTMDGRTFLCIEQNHGARLAIFDVTDPARIKAQGWALVDAPGSFDFVSSLGADAVLVRFRNGQGAAVLNLHKVKTPTLNMIQGLYFQESMEFWGDNALMVNRPPSLQCYIGDADYRVVDISDPLHPNPVTDIKQVLEKITNYDTGTTFLLTPDGLYLIRRPPVEEQFRIREQQLSHTP